MRYEGAVPSSDDEDILNCKKFWRKGMRDSSGLCGGEGSEDGGGY
jgi:hypothetical protein